MFSITTPRLILRDLQPEDEPAMRALRTDPVVTRHIDYIASESDEQVHAWVVETIRHNAMLPRFAYNLTIVRHGDGATLGWIGIGRGDDQERGEMDFGYALLPAYWGQGYTSEALGALLDFVFGELGVARVYGECDADNPASARVMEKAGMRRDPQGEPCDTLRYALSREEWRADRAGAST